MKLFTQSLTFERITGERRKNTTFQPLDEEPDPGVPIQKRDKTS